MGEVKKHIPVIRVGQDDLKMILAVFACGHGLANCARMGERRFRAIPNGWRDLRLAQTIVDRLANDLVMTVPPEKLNGLKRMSRFMKFRVSYGPEASQMGRDECVINEQELNALVASAHDRCALCYGVACEQCELGRALDSILTYDRDGRSWANVDLKSMMHQ